MWLQLVEVMKVVTLGKGGGWEVGVLLRVVYTTFSFSPHSQWKASTEYGCPAVKCWQ